MDDNARVREVERATDEAHIDPQRDAALVPQSAEPHGIAGSVNRHFDGTMTFDDPAVVDEAILAFFTDQRYPTLGLHYSSGTPCRSVALSGRHDYG